MSWLSLHHRLERHTGLLIFGILLVSAIGGMVPMYLLMSAFHATPWLKHFAGRA